MDVEKKKLLSKSSVDKINTSILAYEKVVGSLINATITIDAFLQIKTLQDQILQLSVISPSLNLRRDDISLAFNSRNTETVKFTAFLVDFNNLWQTCKEAFPTGMSELLEDVSSISCAVLNQIMPYVGLQNILFM